MTRVFRHVAGVAAGLLGMALADPAVAWQAPRAGQPPTSGAQFQQAQQQAQLRDQLQSSQLSQQLQRHVSEVAGQADRDDARAQRQREAAVQAQRDRDHAAQQDLLDRARDADTRAGGDSSGH